MNEPEGGSIARSDEAEPVDVVEGPVGSAKLKEPSDVEGSVAPVDRDDAQVEVSDSTANGADPGTTPS